jgi:membrane protein
MSGRRLLQWFKKSFSEWNRHNAPQLGAALSYYSMLSLAPLVVIVVAIAGLAFGAKAARGEIVAQIGGLVGEEGAKGIQTMLDNAHKPGAGIIATVLGVTVLLFGASGVFAELRSSLNRIWDAPPHPDGGFIALIKDRFFSFAMVLGIGFLLLISLVVSAGLSAVAKYLSDALPLPSWILYIGNILVSFVVITLLFALIYKFVPDVKMAWGDIWIGAASTSLLFTIGKFLIGLYLGKASVGSAYGAAGSLVILLVWIYYSAQIFFFGAEFTKIYATEHGSHKGAAKKYMPGLKIEPGPVQRAG